MTFQDLPADWPHRSLDDAQILCDVVDLVVTEADRAAGTIYLIICSELGRMLQPVAVSEIELSERTDQRLVIERFCDILDHGLGAAIAVAIARPGRHTTVDEDREWHEAAVSVCRRRGVRLVGVAVAAPGRVWALPGPGRLPASA